MYIIKSGMGYVLNAETGEMVANRRNPDDGALRAQRMTLSQGEEVKRDMEARGMVAEIVEVRIGRMPTQA